MKGHIRPRGKGTWVIVLDVGRDEKGERRQKWHTVHGTKRDAEAELAQLLHELNTGGYVEPAKLTVAQFMEQWLNDYAQHNVGAKTCQEYRKFVHNHIAPGLGRHKLADLRPLHIQAFYSRMLKEGRVRGTGGLAPQTVIHLHRILHKAMEQAVKWQMVARNPVDAAEPPKAERKEMKVFEAGQVDLLLQAVEGTLFHIPVVLAITTGMRRGEILGLRWQDVDLEAATVTVRRSVEQTQNALGFKEPKTQKSRRRIPLPASVVPILVRHKAWQAQNRLLLGDAYDNQDLVCSREDGSIFPPDHLSNLFRDVLRRAGLPHFRFHDLRHTHATLLLQEGVHAKVVSERLGHSTIGITLDVYSHVLPSLQEEAARKVDNLLRAALCNDR